MILEPLTLSAPRASVVGSRFPCPPSSSRRCPLLFVPRGVSFTFGLRIPLAVGVAASCRLLPDRTQFSPAHCGRAELRLATAWPAHARCSDPTTSFASPEPPRLFLTDPSVLPPPGPLSPERRGTVRRAASLRSFAEGLGAVFAFTPERQDQVWLRRYVPGVFQELRAFKATRSSRRLTSSRRGRSPPPCRGPDREAARR